MVPVTLVTALLVPLITAPWVPFITLVPLITAPLVTLVAALVPLVTAFLVTLELSEGAITRTVIITVLT
jgi:hypothetical protein